MLDPDALALAALKDKYQKQQKLKALLLTMKCQPYVTLDGWELIVYCNIGSPEDIAASSVIDGKAFFE